jgi:hypothetical protein
MAALDNAYAHDEDHDEILRDRIELAQALGVRYEAEAEARKQRPRVLLSRHMQRVQLPTRKRSWALPQTTHLEDTSSCDDMGNLLTAVFLDVDTMQPCDPSQNEQRPDSCEQHTTLTPNAEKCPIPMGCAQPGDAGCATEVVEMVNPTTGIIIISGVVVV